MKKFTGISLKWFLAYIQFAAQNSEATAQNRGDHSNEHEAKPNYHAIPLVRRIMQVLKKNKK